MTRAQARLRDVLDPFLNPRVMARRPRPRPRDWPEHDRMTIEVDAGDWYRLHVLAGTMSTEDLRQLPSASRPSIELIMELEEFEERLSRA
jgi:hypothetical protein